jgi:hypothetical protein
MVQWKHQSGGGLLGMFDFDGKGELNYCITSFENLNEDPLLG